MSSKKTLKKVLIIVGALLLAVLLAALSYVAYVFISYSRIEDNQALAPAATGSDDAVLCGEPYTIVTQNIGFGAYTPDFTFFMDGGTESWAKSKESVIECVTSAAEKVGEFDPDFVLFQEVDTDSTRSYHTDQRKMIIERFADHSSVFAENYHSAFLFYPFNEPHGASNSGILTLSRFNIDSAVRRSLPISESFSKFLDLDRCYSLSRLPTENGKELVIYNVHLSAYGGSDEIRTAQMTMLFNDVKAEYEKGNYCVIGGDFNHDLTGDSTQKLNNVGETDFGWAQPFPDELLPDCITKCTSYEGEEYIPTCRNCDIPYSPENFTIIVDGFLVTENVEAVKVENIDNEFTYSDHNPVVLEFVLKD